LEIPFDEEDNEKLKGVSRMASLEILLSKSPKRYSLYEKEQMTFVKNERYVQLINQLTPQNILPEVTDFLQSCRNSGCHIALGSASKNSQRILEKLSLTPLFDYVVDGTSVSAAKPDPEVFVKSMLHFDLSPKECIVFEDAKAGIEAAQKAGMYSVGIGSSEQLDGADIVIAGFISITLSELLANLNLGRE
jgi:beta-phosphoglucomutase